MYSFDFRLLIYIPIIAILAVWGTWELVDYFFIDEVIKSHTPITPEIQLTVKDNLVDTIYVYRSR